MFDIIRIGKIHIINYANGTASVIYNDRNNQPSPQFPFFSFAYDMPKVNDTVVVILLPNSTSKGFILGVPLGGKRPSVSGMGVFYKEFSDGSYVKYDSKSKTMEISAPNVMLKSISAEKVKVKDELVADEIETKVLRTKKLVTDTAEIVNLNVTGTATGDFKNEDSKEDT